MMAYALAWLAFGVVHSLSSREPAKAALRLVTGRAMRLCWNLLALAELAAVLAVGHASVPAGAFARPGWLVVVQGIALAAGIVVLVMAARCYDMRRFAGLSQLRRDDVEDDEPFSAAGLLAWVRHPLYLGSILVLGGLVRDAMSLQTAVFGTAYFLIGLRFEERALLRRLGAPYAKYLIHVPALLPLRGRAWPPG